MKLPCAGIGNSGWGSCGVWFLSCSLSPGKTEPQMQLLLGPWPPVHSFAMPCLQAVKNCNLRAFSTIFPLSIWIVIEELDTLDLPFFLFFFLDPNWRLKKLGQTLFYHKTVVHPPMSQNIYHFEFWEYLCMPLGSHQAILSNPAIFVLSHLDYCSSLVLCCRIMTWHLNTHSLLLAF